MEINDIVNDFIKVCQIASVSIDNKDIKIEMLLAGEGHRPTSLPRNQCAVYVFLYQGKCLKIGKVGSKSNARFQNQHYSPSSSQSNLAKSVLNDPDFKNIMMQTGIGDWIKMNTTRINLLLPIEKGVFVRNLLEVFFQCRLQPKYEGYDSQR